MLVLSIFYLPRYLFCQIGETIRLLLRYLGVEFEEKQYDCGNGKANEYFKPASLAPNYYQSDYAKEKYSLGLDFPNVS